MKPIQFITLNTGHTNASPRSEVSDKVIALIDKALDTEDGALVDGWAVVCEEHDGYAAFVVSADGFTLSMCVACWAADKSATIWHDMLEAEQTALLEAGGVVMSPRSPPPDTPWLAVIIVSDVARYWEGFGADKARQRLHELGDLERRIGWTLIERSNRKSD